MQSTTAWFVNVVDLTSMQTQACSIITLLFTGFYYRIAILKTRDQPM